MKHSWVMGVVMLYLLVLGVEMMVTGGTAFSSEGQGYLDSLVSPAMSNQSGALTSIVSLAIQVGTYFETFIKAVFLWSPSVWTGYLIWVWFYMCVPLTIAMIIGIIIVLRGSSSG